MIDVFTKFVWVREMKFKDAKWSSESIQSILDDLPEQPVHIISDHGLGESLNQDIIIDFLEFRNNEIRKSLNQDIIIDSFRILEQRS